MTGSNPGYLLKSFLLYLHLLKKLALNSQLLTVKILTDDVLVLILRLSFSITTVLYFTSSTRRVADVESSNFKVSNRWEIAGAPAGSIHLAVVESSIASG